MIKIVDDFLSINVHVSALLGSLPILSTFLSVTFFIAFSAYIIIVCLHPFASVSRKICDSLSFTKVYVSLCTDLDLIRDLHFSGY